MYPPRGFPPRRPKNPRECQRSDPCPRSPRCLPRRLGGSDAHSRGRAQGAGNGTRPDPGRPTAEPPVAKAMDYGQWQYEQKKKQHEAKKKQHVIQVKELKFRPNTDDHDYDFKKNHAIRFLKEGNRVKAVVQFRGREIAHVDLGQEAAAAVCRGSWPASARSKASHDSKAATRTLIISPQGEGKARKAKDQPPLPPAANAAAKPAKSLRRRSR